VPAVYIIIIIITVLENYFINNSINNIIPKRNNRQRERIYIIVHWIMLRVYTWAFRLAYSFIYCVHIILTP